MAGAIGRRFRIPDRRIEAIHQNIDAAEGGQRRLHRPLGIAGSARIDRDRPHGGARFAQFPRERGKAGLVHVA
jgi:hypothetical protein